MSSSSPDLLLIDGSNTVIRGFFGSEPLTNKHGVTLTGMFVYFRMLFKMVNDHPGAWIGVAWDDRSQRRRALYPAYKGNRKPKNPEGAKRREQLHQNLDLAQQLTRLMGIASIKIQGAEADDIVAVLAKQYPGRPIKIVSTDKDFHQCLNQPGVSLDKSTGTVYSKDNFDEAYPGFTPLLWRLKHVLIGGDDNLWKVPGLGPKGFLDLLDPFSDENLSYMHTEAWWEWFSVYTRYGGGKWGMLYQYRNELRLKYQLIDLLETELMTVEQLASLQEQAFVRPSSDLGDLYEFGLEQDIPTWVPDILKGYLNRRADLCLCLKDLIGM